MNKNLLSTYNDLAAKILSAYDIRDDKWQEAVEALSGAIEDTIDKWLWRNLKEAHNDN